MNKMPIKSFYTYDVPENRQMIQGMKIAIVVSVILLIVAIILIFTSPKLLLWSLLILGACAVILVNFIPARKNFENRFKNETIVAHDWGLEILTDGNKKEYKWDRMGSIITRSKNVLFIKQKEYMVTLEALVKKTPKGQILPSSGTVDTISFYSSLENVDFLISFIEKNLKRVAEESIDLHMKKKGDSGRLGSI